MIRDKMIPAMWLAAAILVLGYALSGAVAKADPVTDNAYMSVLEDQGIHYPSTAEAVRDGYRVCTLLDGGYSWVQIAVQHSANSGLDVGDSAFFVGASIAAYCDEYAYLIDGEVAA